MKKSEGNRLKYAVCESTLSTAARSLSQNGEGKEEAASPPKKEANPASLRSAAPSKGRGSRGHSLLPMEGGAPKGRRLDGGSGMKKDRGRSSQVCRLREHPSAAARSPFPKGENYDDTRMPLFSHCQSEYTHMWKKNNDGQSLPLEGKVPRRGG